MYVATASPVDGASQLRTTLPGALVATRLPGAPGAAGGISLGGVELNGTAGASVTGSPKRETAIGVNGPM